MKNLSSFVGEAVKSDILFTDDETAKIKNILSKEIQHAEKISVVQKDYGFGDPSATIIIQFIPEDVRKSSSTYGIFENTLHIRFTVDPKSCDIFTTGHVALSDYDSEHSFKYLASRNMKEMAKTCGVNVRKFRYKNIDDLANKIAKMSNEIFDVVLCYYGGDVELAKADKTKENRHKRGTITTDLVTAWKNYK